MEKSGTIVLPQPHEISEREKEDAMGAYLMMFAAWGVGLPLPLINLIAAVIYFIINKSESKFVAFHSYQSLLTQIPISFLNAGVIAWIIAIISPKYSLTSAFFAYILFVLIWNLSYMVFSIIACVKARKGKFYYFWVFGRLAFAKYYLNTKKEKALETNLPPEGM